MEKRINASGARCSRSGMEDNVVLAPEFADIRGWINSPPLKLSELKGRVVFLDFWTYSCQNCIRSIPSVRSLHEKYSSMGLVVIGVHTPEFEFEKDVQNVTSAVKRLEVVYPVALDTENSTWKLYGNRYWPRQTIVDGRGVVRYEHIGEGGYEEIEEQVVGLLAELRASAGDRV